MALYKKSTHLNIFIKLLYDEIAMFLKISDHENSLAVQWLGVSTFTVKGLGSIPSGELGFYKSHGMAKKYKI